MVSRGVSSKSGKVLRQDAPGPRRIKVERVHVQLARVLHADRGLEFPGAFLKPHDPVFPQTVGHGKAIARDPPGREPLPSAATVPSGFDYSQPPI